MMRITVLTVLLITLGPTMPIAIATADRPNVLFIALDDMNDWVGCLGGHPQVKTPHMDRLARSGTVFLNAHCQSPQCNSSRTSLLTGMRPSTTGVYALEPWFRSATPLKNLITLPQHFASQGYTTLSAGKIFHDGYPPRSDRANGAEFNTWGPQGNFGPYPENRFVKTPREHRLIDWGVFPERDQDQEDWKVADWAIQQLKSLPKDRPFLLCAGFRRPHVPCYASQRWFDLYPDETLVMPPIKAGDREDTPLFSWYLHWRLPEPRLSWLQANNQWRPLVRAYLASVSFADSQVGRLLDALKDSGFADRTVVVLWGDNGWHLGDKGITGKTSLWDGSTRVPLIFSGPGVAAAGRCPRPAELLDIYPTLVELCGLPAKPDLEGHSLVPQLREASAPRLWPAITTHGQNNHGIRTEQWRYIRYADGSQELYDMIADPEEWTNIAADPRHAQTIEELARWLPKVNTLPIPGSKSRLIQFEDGKLIWEGRPIGPDDPIEN